MGLEEIKTRIEAGELASTLSRESWERRLELVKKKNFTSLDELLEYLDNNNIDHRCALCHLHFLNNCRGCILYELSENCLTSDTAYDKVFNAQDTVQLVEAIENLISVLRKAEEYERNSVEN